MSTIFIALGPLLVSIAIFLTAALPMGSVVPEIRGRGRWHVLVLYLFPSALPAADHRRASGAARLGAAGGGGDRQLDGNRRGRCLSLTVWVAELAAAALVYAWWLALVGLPQRQGLPRLVAAPWAARLLATVSRLLRRPLGTMERNVDRVSLGAATVAGLYYAAAAVVAQPDGRTERFKVGLVAAGVALILWLVFFGLAPHVRALIIGLVDQADKSAFPGGAAGPPLAARPPRPGFRVFG